MAIRRLRLVSNNICFGPTPMPHTEVEQRLTVSEAGRVWFNAYNYGYGVFDYTPGRKQQLSIDKDVAARLLLLAADYSKQCPNNTIITDIGSWTMTLYESDGSKQTLQGGLCGGVAAGGADLTDAMREAIPIDGLWAFDAAESRDTEAGDDTNVVLFPEYEALKKEVEKLRTEISMLVLERDNLLYVECKNIEMSYMLALGSIEYKLYESECKMLRLKRKAELIRAKRNRQEKVLLSEIDDRLDEEFAEYKARLEAHIDKVNAAIKRNQGDILTEEETKELKRLYRKTVKALHPDLHPNLDEAHMRLFLNAVAAYESGDLATLRLISEMVSDADASDEAPDAMLYLINEKDRLTDLLKELDKSIADIKSEYPYTVRELVYDKDKIARRRAELEDIIDQYESATQVYAAEIEKMVNGNG